MLKKVFFLLTIVLLFSSLANSQGLLRTEGTNIVDENGDNFLLRGMGLGGWMLQEGYMLQTAGFASAQYQIKGKIEELIGTEKTEIFYDAWLANHVTKADIDALKSWGFNSVRLPMHYNLFTLPIEDEPVENVNTWLEKGFVLTDSLISWCAQNEMYVILDLHAAPGGQGYDQAISDYDPTKPSIFESIPNRNKAAALWRKLAERYVDETWVAGYDLLNEPNWNVSGNTLRAIYRQMTDSIRSVDNNHMLFIEGNWFANDFTGLTPPWDDNMVYSPHKYWSINDQASIQWVLDIRETHNVPLYLGESGENSNLWFRDAIALLEEHNIGWAWWPMKKVESIAGPLSVIKSTAYNTLLNYWNNGGTTPTEAFAEAALMDLTEKLKFENCRFQKDVIDAMFRQVNSTETIPYTIQNIPGIVHSTDFSMGLPGEAYFESGGLANYSVSTGNYSSWNDGWAYRNDAVDIEVSSDNSTITNGYNIGFLGTGEWMQYDVNVDSEALYDIEVRVAAGATGGKFHFSANGADLTSQITVPNTGGWQNWQTVTVQDVVLSSSDDKLRFYVDQEGFNLGSFKFTETGATTMVSTKYVHAITENENTVQLFVNKTLTNPLPAAPANFVLFVNGTSVAVTNVELDTDNNRIVRLTVDHQFKSSETITISYTGTNITATDGTALTIFSQQPVENTIFAILPIPGKVEAEDFFFQSGIQLENTSDVGGGQNVGYLDPGDYLDYYVDVNQSGLYKLDYRTAAESESGRIELQVIDANGNATEMHSISFPPTGGWQTWTTTSANVAFFSPGQKHIRILIKEPLFNLNWLDFSFLTSTDEPTDFGNILLYPNPSSGLFFLTGVLQKANSGVIDVYNLLGENIWNTTFTSSKELSTVIDLSSFEAGQYFAKIQTETGETKVIKLMKVE